MLKYKDPRQSTLKLWLLFTSVVVFWGGIGLSSLHQSTSSNINKLPANMRPAAIKVLSDAQTNPFKWNKIRTDVPFLRRAELEYKQIINLVEEKKTEDLTKNDVVNINAKFANVLSNLHAVELLPVDPLFTKVKTAQRTWIEVRKQRFGM